MEFHLLGPVEARREGLRIAVPGTKMRTVLAALLLARGRVVPDSRLSALLWGANPPATMSAQIHTYVSRLRKLLEPEVSLERRAPGYVIVTTGCLLDVVEYERLDRSGRQALQDGRYDAAGTLLRNALELWRGPALADVTEFLEEEEAPHWQEEYAATLENRLEADLALGGHQRITAELIRLVVEFPLRERMRAQLMTALYRCGRQSEAFQVFDEGRELLADELGVGPGHDLREAHQGILCGNLAWAPEPGTAVGVGAGVGTGADVGVARAVRALASAPAGHVLGAAPAGLAVVRSGSDDRPPAMLPPDIAPFTGRERELAVLRALLAPGDAQDAPQARRCLITGMAGVGKTALAVRAAHAAQEHFPDGQLHAELVGRDGRPEDPRRVLAGLLRALGHEVSERVSHDLDELVRIYRTRTAGRRLLVILDGAVDSDQLDPLLPASAHSATLVTGNSHLVVSTGPVTLAVGPMDDDAALELLSALAGAARVAADPEAAAQLVGHCAGLPLALRIAGAKLVSRPHWSPARLARRLADPGARLSELSFGGLDVDRTLRDWLRRTDGAGRTVLSKLSVLGERPFSAAAAATVLGLQDQRAEDLLEELADSSLIEPARPPRGTDATGAGPLQYRFHRLVLLCAQAPVVHRPFPAALAS
ncbi:AfsR/SARP family transcriptional regulator [Streptomyces sp. NBC_01257]|uniref:AfsR/SARP family transcriptional regulator n=1 Tax=Streptomyces sp. NBC_01257 TaxID=2903799 RepID=UPI002DDA86A1|nr:AfsR/SARP family transcriptional regulator [Streptomyces sp. NBC_01257]WRZ64892.1 AfsR/SARP family transcriptional regulator [Streptomyces sp. NBC_01257]